MAADDLYLALVQLNDEDVRTRAKNGDLADFAELDFKDEEKELIQGVIEELAEDPDTADVVGFKSRSKTFRAFSYASGNVSRSLLLMYPPSGFSFGPVFAACGAGTCAQCKGKAPAGINFVFEG